MPLIALTIETMRALASSTPPVWLTNKRIGLGAELDLAQDGAGGARGRARGVARDGLLGRGRDARQQLVHRGAARAQRLAELVHVHLVHLEDEVARGVGVEVVEHAVHAQQARHAPARLQRDAREVGAASAARGRARAAALDAAGERAHLRPPQPAPRAARVADSSA